MNRSPFARNATNQIANVPMVMESLSDITRMPLSTVLAKKRKPKAESFPISSRKTSSPLTRMRHGFQSHLTVSSSLVMCAHSDTDLWVVVRFVDNSDPYAQDLDDMPMPPVDGGIMDHTQPGLYMDSMYPGGMPLGRVGLDALSAVAAGNHYSNTSQDTESTLARNAISLAENHNAERIAQAGGHVSPVHHQLSLLLNPSSADENTLIDPNLGPTASSEDQYLDPALSAHHSSQYVKTDGQPETEHEAAYHLPEFNGEPGTQSAT